MMQRNVKKHHGGVGEGGGTGQSRIKLHPKVASSRYLKCLHG